jgi:MoaA/NifB/PqqE/SkfB family radical SAM enzyme
MYLKQAIEEIRLFARGYAPVANISVNTVCNQRCLMCRCWHMRWHRESDKLTLDEIKELVRQLVEELHVKRFRITSTEPLLRSDLPEIIRHIRRFAGCSLITNGMAMTPELARELIRADVSIVRFSIDAPNEVNDTLRGSKDSWERSKRGMRMLYQAREDSGKSNPRIEIYSVLTSLNIKYIPDLYRFVAEHNLDGMTFGIVWENTQTAVDQTIWKGEAAARGHMVPQESSIMPSRRQVARLRNELVRMGLITKRTERFKRAVENVLSFLEGRRSFFRCPQHYFINIDAVGNIIPCSVLGDLSFGNIRDKKARDIWFNREHYEFLARVGRDPFPVCREICDAKDKLYLASLKSEMRGLVTSLLYPLNMRSFYKSAVSDSIADGVSEPL